MAQDFNRVFATGAWSERKRFVRCFLRQIHIDPVKETGSIEWFRVPCADRLVTARSGSLVSLVAGGAL